MLKQLRESSNPAESYRTGKFTLTKFISVLASSRERARTRARRSEREKESGELVDRIVEKINGLR